MFNRDYVADDPIPDNPVGWVKRALRRSFDFSGRAPRPEYWWLILLSAVVLAVAIALDGLVMPAGKESLEPFTILWGVLFLVPTLSAMVRRNHDIGQSGWWVLILLLPYVGGIWNVVNMATAGQPGENKYGLPPYGLPTADDLLAEPVIRARR